MRNPATLVWNSTQGNATADVYRITGKRYEIDVANNSSKYTLRAPDLQRATEIAQQALGEMAANPRLHNGFLSSIFGKRETYRSRIVRVPAGHAGHAGGSRSTKTQQADASAELKADVVEALAGLGMTRSTAKAKVNAKYHAGDSVDSLFKRIVGRSNPGTFDRCIQKVKARGTGNAYAICAAAGAGMGTGMRRNPEAEAAELSAEFHGRPPQEVNEVIEDVHYHENLMQIGPLLELEVETVSGYLCVLQFPPADALDRVILAWSEDGSSAYLVGGDQEIDLADLRMDAKRYRKDLMVIGAIQSWVYYAEKEQDHWKGSEYFHTSREGLSADGTRHKVVADTDTMLLYDTRSKLLQCAGGEANLYDAAAGIVG